MSSWGSAQNLQVDPDGPLRGRVIVVERLGSETYAHVEISPQTILVAQVDGNSPIRTRDQVRLSAVAEASHVFAGDGKAFPALARHPLAADATG